MQGAATKAMPLRIGEERRRRRRPRAAATARGGWPLARNDSKAMTFLIMRASLRRDLQKARHDARIHFSAPCLLSAGGGGPYYRSMGWERDLHALEEALRSLNAQYDAFLYGSSLKPPVEVRRRVGRQIQRLSHTESDSSADRFRFMALQGRYNSLAERWDRLQSEKESGRRPGIYGHLLRLPGTDTPEAPNVRPPASVEGVERVAEKDARVPPSADPDRDLFTRYVEAKRAHGEEVAGLRFERFAEKLADQREKLKEHFSGADIAFDVAERNGKVRLVAKPKEESKV